MNYEQMFKETYDAGALIIFMLKEKGFKVSWWNLAEIFRGLVQTAELVVEGIKKGTDKKKLVIAVWKELDKAFKIKKKLPLGWFLKLLPFGLYGKIVDAVLETVVWLLKTLVWKDNG